MYIVHARVTCIIPFPSSSILGIAQHILYQCVHCPGSMLPWICFRSQHQAVETIGNVHKWHHWLQGEGSLSLVTKRGPDRTFLIQTYPVIFAQNSDKVVGGWVLKRVPEWLTSFMNVPMNHEVMHSETVVLSGKCEVTKHILRSKWLSRKSAEPGGSPLPCIIHVVDNNDSKHDSR